MARERSTAAAWLAAGERATVVEVLRTRGSVPRGPGTRMLVGTGAVAGTIGGGHLELKAIAHARRRLADSADAPDERRFPLGPALGQCCGGAVTLRFAPLDAAALAAWPPSTPLFHLQLHGAGHVGRAIARALAPLDATIDWIDERDDEFPAAFADGGVSWPAQVRKLCVDAPQAEVAAAPAGAFFLVLTHRHDLDLRIAEAVLRRGDFGFLGLIGSKTKRQRFEHHFERRGIAAGTVARMACPIGIDGIDGNEPEVIAVAVAAQLLRVASLALKPGSGRTAAI